MDGLEAIRQSILLEAQEKAGAIMEQARQAAAEIEESTDRTCEQYLAESRQKAEIQAAAVRNRARSMAAMDRRKGLLLARQDLINRAILLASEQLCQLPDQIKTDFYRRLLKQANIKKGAVVLTARDMHLGPGILEGMDDQVRLDPQPGAFNGGLIVKQDFIEDNLTVDLLVKNMRPQLIHLAAAILFPERDRSEQDVRSS